MGSWALRHFGVECLPHTAIIFAGTTTERHERDILKALGTVVHKNAGVSHNYLLERDGLQFVVVFQVYGAPFAIDLLHVLHDGGCKNVFFFGYAYSDFLPVASYMVPSRVFCLDGVTTLHAPRLKTVSPDKRSQHGLMSLMRKNGLAFYRGSSVSITSIFHRVQGIKDRIGLTRVPALEMELSSVLYFSRSLGMSCAAVLVISDNKTKRLQEGRKLRAEAMLRLMTVVGGSLRRL